MGSLLKFSGNQRQLEKFARKFEDAGDVIGILAVQYGEESFNLVRKQFDDHADPYGKKWPARVRVTKRNKGKALLVDTGLMRLSAHVVLKATEFTIRFARSYAHWHQSGTPLMKRRMLVPTSDQGLPRKWAEEFKLVYEDVMEVMFGG